MLWLDELLEGWVPASGAPPTNDPQDGPEPLHLSPFASCRKWACSSCAVVAIGERSFVQHSAVVVTCAADRSSIGAV